MSLSLCTLEQNSAPCTPKALCLLCSLLCCISTPRCNAACQDDFVKANENGEDDSYSSLMIFCCLYFLIIDKIFVKLWSFSDQASWWKRYAQTHSLFFKLLTWRRSGLDPNVINYSILSAARTMSAQICLLLLGVSMTLQFHLYYILTPFFFLFWDAAEVSAKQWKSQSHFQLVISKIATKKKMSFVSWGQLAQSSRDRMIYFSLLSNNFPDTYWPLFWNLRLIKISISRSYDTDLINYTVLGWVSLCLFEFASLIIAPRFPPLLQSFFFL